MKLAGTVLITATCIATILAQNAKSGDTTQPNPTKTQSSVEQVQQGTEKRMTGMLVSVDISKQTFAIQLRGTAYPFQVNASTKIEGKNGSVALNDLKSGNSISVTYIKNSNNRIALTISQSVAVSASTKDASPVKTSTAPAKAESKQTPPATKPAQATVQPTLPSLKPQGLNTAVKVDSLHNKAPVITQSNTEKQKNDTSITNVNKKADGQAKTASENATPASAKTEPVKK